MWNEIIEKVNLGVVWQSEEKVSKRSFLRLQFTAEFLWDWHFSFCLNYLNIPMSFIEIFDMTNSLILSKKRKKLNHRQQHRDFNPLLVRTQTTDWRALSLYFSQFFFAKNCWKRFSHALSFSLNRRLLQSLKHENAYISTFLCCAFSFACINHKTVKIQKEFSPQLTIYDRTERS